MSKYHKERKYAKFRYYMEKYYVLPLELKNDIIYCQRSLRDFLKVHAVSAPWLLGEHQLICFLCLCSLTYAVGLGGLR